MHDIEPYFKWRDYYVASEDRLSPFYGRRYDEFTFRNKIYNYFIHPQWDYFGSSTIYMKILFVDYDQQAAVIELIGEWNDAINNDVMYIKREIVDLLQRQGIFKYIIMCEQVLNFHSSDDSYYEEWYEDVNDEKGWICFIDLLEHVRNEMKTVQIHHYVNWGEHFDALLWKSQKPDQLIKMVDNFILGKRALLS